MGADGDSLQHLVRVAFQDGPVHVGPGVSLISIADNGFFLAL